MDRGAVVGPGRLSDETDLPCDWSFINVLENIEAPPFLYIGNTRFKGQTDRERLEKRAEGLEGGIKPTPHEFSDINIHSKVTPRHF